MPDLLFPQKQSRIILLLEKIKYPKLLLLLLTFIVGYFLFHERATLPFHDELLVYWYIGSFFAGLFFVYGFTAAPATAILLILGKSENIILVGLVAGLGALLGDFIIFRLIQHSFADEIERVTRWQFWLHFIRFSERTPEKIKKYVTPVLAGFIIASPLPDEIGVSLLAASGKISTPQFAKMAYLLNTAGIFVVLIIGASI